jgi:uncharacterized protein (DUF1501 family)
MAGIEVHTKRLSRREFLKLGGMMSLGLALSACDLKVGDVHPIRRFQMSG